MIRPSFLRRQLAYLHNGDLPPVPTFRAPRISVSGFAVGYFVAVALGGFGFGLILAGGLL